MKAETRLLLKDKDMGGEKMIFYKNKWSMFSIIFYWILSIVMILNYIHYHLSTGHFGGAEGGIPLFYEIIFSANQIMIWFCSIYDSTAILFSRMYQTKDNTLRLFTICEITT